MDPENEIIFGRMLELAGPEGQIGVLPTASGVPERSGPLTVGDFELHGAKGRTELIDITRFNPEEADNPEKAAQIASKDLVFFTGGYQGRIVDAFLPGDEDPVGRKRLAGTREVRKTLGYEALESVLKRGGTIAGSSAGAAMMSDPMIRWGNSEEALLVGLSEAEDRGLAMYTGMGFFPYGVTGQHFIRRGRLGRLLVAAHLAGDDFAWGVAENSALDVNLATHQIALIGKRVVLMADMREAKRVGRGFEGVRLAMLGGGDTINGLTGAISFAENKNPLDLEMEGETPVLNDPWGDYMIAKAIEAIVVNQSSSARIAGDHFDITLTRDGRTRFAILPAYDIGEETDFEDRSLSVANLVMDVIEKPTAAAAAEKLKPELERIIAEQEAAEE